MQGKRLGEILISLEQLTLEGLEEGLRLQQISQEPLGRILIRLGLVSEREIVSALSLQQGIPEIHLFQEIRSREILELLPQGMVLRYKVIPVRRSGDQLLVAMADPLDILALDHIRRVTQLEVLPAIASEEEMERFIGQYYGLEELALQASQKDDALGEGMELWEIEADSGDEAVLVRLVNKIISQAVRMAASDIHIEPFQDKLVIRYRVDGILRPIMELPLGLSSSLVSRIKIMANLDITERRLPQDGRLHLKTEEGVINLRLAILPTLFGEKIVARILDGMDNLILLENLGFTPEALDQYRQLITNTEGMVLITGPTGSGKTSTLYATLHDIKTPAKNIMTIEDPVEYVIAGVNQIRVTGKPDLGFAKGLRGILRQDPDIIMVGEIRDQETAEIAVRAAITGHLVFSTLHTADAVGAITRLMDMGVEPYMVASSIRGVVAQRLVRRLCPNCRETYRPQKGSREALFLEVLGYPLGQVARGLGCNHCENTGYKGRLAILEILPIFQELRQGIMHKESRQELKRTALKHGLTALQEDGINKAFAGQTSIAEVMRVAYVDEG